MLIGSFFGIPGLKKPTVTKKYFTAFSELDWKRLIVMTNKRKTKEKSSLKGRLKTAETA